jgi:hypothetical protein
MVMTFFTTLSLLNTVLLPALYCPLPTASRAKNARAQQVYSLLRQFIVREVVLLGG